MRHKKLKISAVLLLGLGLTGLHAQESVNGTGGNASGSGGSASFSVGQVVYLVHTGTTGSVAEGVQQPYEISVATAIEVAKGINLSVSAYPNPTSDYLQLQVESKKLKDFSFKLFDVYGKLLQEHKNIGTVTQIEMSHYKSGVYFLKVLTNNQLIKTFKIIKTQ